MPSGKLKLRCGSQFTGKMEGMMNDLAIGGDHEANFAKHLKGLEEGGTVDVGKVDFNVQVLTTGYWPSYKPLEVTLPKPMMKCTQVFEKYYDETTSHRRLAWTHSLGNVTVRAKYAKVYDLQVTTLQ
ncbi:unnamed protein product, partial [Choristocarpus tenellus]